MESHIGLLSQPGGGESTVTGPLQVPARVLSLSKAFCASDFGASDWAACLCASAWAKAIAESDRTATESRMRRDFMVKLLEAAGPLYSDIVNYNTKSCQEDFDR